MASADASMQCGTCNLEFLTRDLQRCDNCNQFVWAPDYERDYYCEACLREGCNKCDPCGRWCEACACTGGTCHICDEYFCEDHIYAGEYYPYCKKCSKRLGEQRACASISP